MKKIIPFEKELVFKTKVCEITAISIEHNYKMEDADLITGNFLISGEYKMTEGSINREKFEYNIPFDIALDSRYDTNNIVVDIDDFNYSVINNDILKVRIVLYIEGDLVKEAVPTTEKMEESQNSKNETDIDFSSNVEMPELVQSVKYERNEEKELKKDFRQLPKEEPEIELNVENVNINNNNVIDPSKMQNSMFNNLESGETYSTYHVYIVKEDDTIDKILEKYQISKEELSVYNDLNEIKIGDKLIIPTIYNG